jgi:hypothetical protein
MYCDSTKFMGIVAETDGNKTVTLGKYNEGWKDHVMHGKGKMTCAYPVLHGFLEYNGGFDKGQFHSKISLNYRDGAVYEGDF